MSDLDCVWRNVSEVQPQKTCETKLSVKVLQQRYIQFNETNHTDLGLIKRL